MKTSRYNCFRFKLVFHQLETTKKNYPKKSFVRDAKTLTQKLYVPTLINKSISFHFISFFFFLKEIDSCARVFAEISRAVNTLVVG